MNKFSVFARDYWPIYRTWQFNTPVIHLLLPEHVEVSELKRGRFICAWERPGVKSNSHTPYGTWAFLYYVDQIYKLIYHFMDHDKNRVN